MLLRLSYHKAMKMSLRMGLVVGLFSTITASSKFQIQRRGRHRWTWTQSLFSIIFFSVNKAKIIYRFTPGRTVPSFVHFWQHRVIVCIEHSAAPMSGRYWGPWGPWSDCSRTCSLGLRLRRRQCLEQDTNGRTRQYIHCRTFDESQESEWVINARDF